MRLNDRGVQALSAAIIVQGIRDYNYCRNAVENNRRTEKMDGDRYAPEMRMNEIECFFRGRWFCVLSNEMDGERLLSILCDACGRSDAIANELRDRTVKLFRREGWKIDGHKVFCPECKERRRKERTQKRNG